MAVSRWNIKDEDEEEDANEALEEREAVEGEGEREPGDGQIESEVTIFKRGNK